MRTPSADIDAAFAAGRESGLRNDDRQCPYGYLQEAEAKAWWEGVENGLRVRRNLNKLCTS